MPALAPRGIRIRLAVPFTVEGGHPTQFVNNGADGGFIARLAIAMNAGWTCASPTTPSTFGPTFSAEFSDYTGPGAAFVTGIAAGLDDEIDDWVASWDSTLGIHTYVVNAASIKSRIMGYSQVNSVGTNALAQAVANAFMDGFLQEVG
jgi:hypothetical protein